MKPNQIVKPLAAQGLKTRVETHLMRSEAPMTVAELSKAMRESVERVRIAVQNLIAEKRIHNVGARGQTGSYSWGRDTRIEAPRPRAQVQHRGGDYDGAELRPLPLPASRYHAFSLPSLVNGVPAPPKRPVAQCVGALKDTVANAR